MSCVSHALGGGVGGWPFTSKGTGDTAISRAGERKSISVVVSPCLSVMPRFLPFPLCSVCQVQRKQVEYGPVGKHG